MAVAMATEIGKQVPVKQVYDDAASPAMRQVGATLEDVVKCIRLVGLPVQWLAVQQDRFRAFIEKAKEPVPEEMRILPAPQILGPILEGIRYEVVDSPITEMFQNLLSSAMDIDAVDNVHPSFVGIVKSLSSDEAKILRELVKTRILCIDVAEGILHIGSKGAELFQVDHLGLQFPENANFYVERLFSLGLLDWDHKMQGVTEYQGRRVGQSALMLSQVGSRLMAACRVTP